MWISGNRCRYTYKSAYTPTNNMTQLIDTGKKKVAIVTTGINHKRLHGKIAVVTRGKRLGLRTAFAPAIQFGKSKILTAAMEVDEDYKRFRAKLEKGVRSAIREGVGIPKSR